MKVLVVDDDRALRDALRRALSLDGHDVDVAGNGQHGLSCVAAVTPDAVVLDVGMPDIDGLEVCRRLRSAGNRVPVLMLTARDAVEDRTTPGKLRDALGAAEDAQPDEAVKEGRLTQEQADQLKRRRQESGRVLGLPCGRGRHGHHFRGRPGRDPIADVASALGITERRLFNRLGDGRTIEQIANAEGKTLADVKSAVRASLRTRLDEAVGRGRLTQAQADEMLEHAGDIVDRLGDRPSFGRGHHHGS